MELNTITQENRTEGSNPSLTALAKSQESDKIPTSGRFVSIAAVVPPAEITLMLRDGSNVYDGFYSKWRDQWFMLVPGGSPTRIAPPDSFFLRDCDLMSLPAEQQAEAAKPLPIARRGQMLLNLGRVA